MAALRRNGTRIPLDVALAAGSAPPDATAKPSLTRPMPESGELESAACDLLEQLLRSPGQPARVIRVRCPALSVGASSDPQRGAVSAPVARAVAYLKLHARERVKVPEVARHAGCSRRSLEQHFAEEIGITLHDFLVREQTELAMREIAESPGKPLRDVARDCGFRGERAFRSAFVAWTGKLPAQWRAARGQGDAEMRSIVAPPSRPASPLAAESPR
jgi:AraC-like DNA-binding protein